jgi:hypothetical protein
MGGSHSSRSKNPAVRRRPGTGRPGLVPAVAARPGKSAALRRTLCSFAVIMPLRQQPGPILIFRLTENRRSRLTLDGNPLLTRSSA